MQQQGSSAHVGDAAAGLESPPLSPATAAAAALQNARWSPSKEQVAVLEGLYDHGLRTPSAEQIQHITARLREHGAVEAKNVFYWFQNHKARSRQRMKQDNFAYFTRLLRRPPPLPLLAKPPGTAPYAIGRSVPASAPPVISLAPPQPQSACNSNGGVGGAHHVMYRSPYYMSPPSQASSVANAPGYYNLQQQAAHHMAYMYPRLGIAQDDQQMNPAVTMYQQAATYGTTGNPLHVATAANGAASSADHDAGRTRQTLELFPLRPTFLLPDNNKACGSSVVLTSPSTLSASASFSGGEESQSQESPADPKVETLPFYDFFGLQSAGPYVAVSRSSETEPDEMLFQLSLCQKKMKKG